MHAEATRFPSCGRIALLDYNPNYRHGLAGNSHPTTTVPHDYATFHRCGKAESKLDSKKRGDDIDKYSPEVTIHA
jgi:hypothetical protein